MSHSGWHRRSFLKTSALVTAGLALPAHNAFGTSLAGWREGTPDEERSADTAESLAQYGVDAATAAGASHAEVQIRYLLYEWHYALASWSRMQPGSQYRFLDGLSVRVLVNGYWGYIALTGVPTKEMVAYAAQEAVAQAKVSSGGKSKELALAPVAPVQKGRWATPVEIDPFQVPAEEKIDFAHSIVRYADGVRYANESMVIFTMLREQRSCATSNGSLFTQTLYTTGGDFRISLQRAWMTEVEAGWASVLLSPAGRGWEHICRAPLRERVTRMIGMGELLQPRPKFVDIGRYDIVFDARSTANLLDKTIGSATELDRALGYHANNVGTSFLDQPLEMLGTYKIGSPLVTVTANRSMSGGAATVKWDDEGVAPADATLVENGILKDFQTSRETAAQLTTYYEQQGKTVRSNGCAGSDLVTSLPSQCPPNLALAPGANELSMEEMIRDVKTGIAVFAGRGDVDHQCLNGGGQGAMLEIKNGKLGQPIKGGLYLYRTPDFWQQVTALGGPSSQVKIGMTRVRSRINTLEAHTVTAVPMTVRNVRVSDVSRSV